MMGGHTLESPPTLLASPSGDRHEGTRLVVELVGPPLEVRPRHAKELGRSPKLPVGVQQSRADLGIPVVLVHTLGMLLGFVILEVTGEEAARFALRCLEKVVLDREVRVA